MNLFNVIYFNILPFLIILSILVFVHELGHYLVARWNNVKVEAFSIGFGPELFGWTDQAGTRWKISLIPMGGYVKMSSDLNAASQPDQASIDGMSEEDKKTSLYHKPVGQRIAVSIAGPAANYLFAILIFGTLYITQGQQVPSTQPKIGQVLSQSRAEQAGLKKGDLILSVDKQSIASFSDLQKIIEEKAEQELDLNILRDDHRIHLKVTPSTDPNEKMKTGRLGVIPFVETIKYSPLTAYFYATKEIFNFSVKTVQYLAQVIVGKHSSAGFSGPLGIAALTGEVAHKGLTEILWFMGFLSINLGLINLFPVPMLDGGHLLFYIIEAIRGKAVSEKIQEWGYRIGFAIILFLMTISTWNDLKHLKVFDFFKKIFH